LLIERCTQPGRFLLSKSRHPFREDEFREGVLEREASNGIVLDGRRNAHSLHRPKELLAFRPGERKPPTGLHSR